MNDLLVPSQELQTLQAIFAAFPVPSVFMVSDCETTGFSPTSDFIIDVGWAIGKNGSLHDCGNLLLNWSLVPGVDHGFIRSQLVKQARNYAEAGRPHFYSWERLCDEGIHPHEAMYAYIDTMYRYITSGKSAIVGHGLWSFDRRMINAYTSKYMSGYSLPWDIATIFDTGIVEKAMQCNRPPMGGEQLDEWNYAVNSLYSRCKWNLSGHCAQKYGLFERYGLDGNNAHTGGFDCQLVYYFLDTLIRLAAV